MTKRLVTSETMPTEGRFSALKSFDDGSIAYIGIYEWDLEPQKTLLDVRRDYDAEVRPEYVKNNFDIFITSIEGE